MADASPRRGRGRAALRLTLGSAALLAACGPETVDLFPAAGGQAPGPGGAAAAGQEVPAAGGVSNGAAGEVPWHGGSTNTGTGGWEPSSGGGRGSGEAGRSPGWGGSGGLGLAGSGPVWGGTGGIGWGGESPGLGGSGATGYAGEGPTVGGPGSPCLGPHECEPELYCDPFAQVCVQRCRSNEDCSGLRPICDRQGDPTGRCVECTEDAHCESAPYDRPVCLSFAGVCVQCFRDEDCDYPTAFCHPGTFTCAECLTSEHCDAGLQCDPQFFLCLPW